MNLEAPPCTVSCLNSKPIWALFGFALKFPSPTHPAPAASCLFLFVDVIYLAKHTEERGNVLKHKGNGISPRRSYPKSQTREKGPAAHLRSHISGMRFRH